MTSEYMESLKIRGIIPGLERIKELLNRLGNPEVDTPTIHISGTNGKGSVSCMLASILSCAGYRVATFNSPYMTDYRESFREYNEGSGEIMSEKDFSELIDEIRVAETKGEAIYPTEFEVLTAVAFCYFRKKRPDIAIVECGLGGKGDATNVLLHPLLSIITNVSLEHVGILGDTTEKIAEQKAGIIKENVPVVTGCSEKIIKEISDKNHAPLYEISAENIRLKDMNLSGMTVDFFGCLSADNDKYKSNNFDENIGENNYNNNYNNGTIESESKNKTIKDLKVSLIGDYQLENINLALTSIEVLKKHNHLNISKEAIYRGLSCTKWPGRFEVISENPTIIYDGSHNSDGIKKLVMTVKKIYPGKRILVLMGVMADKDCEKMVENLSAISRKIFTVTPDNKRALPSDELSKLCKSYDVESEAYTDLKEGFLSAREEADKTQDVLLITGSLYMYKDIVSFFHCPDSFY